MYLATIDEKHTAFLKKVDHNFEYDHKNNRGVFKKYSLIRDSNYTKLFPVLMNDIQTATFVSNNSI